MDRGRALVVLKALLDDSDSEYGRAVRLLVLEQIQKRKRRSAAVCAGLDRARARGVRLGRPVVHVSTVLPDLSVRQAARALGVSRSTVQRWRRRKKLSTEEA